MRQINEAGIKLIKEHEGCELKPYRDSAGYWTIGVGHLIRPGEHFTTITDAEAETILQADLASARAAVVRLVRVPLTDNQFAALVSFVFNVGSGAFENSTLLRLLNEGDFDGAAAQFARWNRAGGRVLKGLTKRRAAEAKLFLSSMPEVVQA